MAHRQMWHVLFNSAQATIQADPSRHQAHTGVYTGMLAQAKVKALISDLTDTFTRNHTKVVSCHT